MEKLSTSNGLVSPRAGHSLVADGLAFKAFEIEELADIYFFRPLGLVVARCAERFGITPTQLTMLSMLPGVIGGILLCDQHLAYVGFALIIIYSVFDSADGQLARLTDQVTELGRVLDGVGGYVTHAAIYISICAGLLYQGASGTIVIWAVLAVIANTIQAQMYDYHRHHYAMIVVKRRIPRDDLAKIALPSIRSLYDAYLAMQRALNGLHVQVEAAINNRAVDGIVSREDQARYRRCFCWPVHGWNFLGDNARFFAIGLLVFLHRVDLFFAFILIPMNLVLLVLWFWERHADRKFLATV
jgi:hypothetical protein